MPFWGSGAGAKIPPRQAPLGGGDFGLFGSEDFALGELELSQRDRFSFVFCLKRSCFGWKVLEKSLRILFETADVSLVRAFVQRQLVKLLQGKVSLQDLVIAKEFRGPRGYRPGACVPALELSR